MTAAIAEIKVKGPAVKHLKTGTRISVRFFTSVLVVSAIILVAQGVGIWVGFQAFINMGVNLGALPTKGLTLPFMSYGGSAILINLVAVAVVLRVDVENRQLMRGGRV